MNKPEQMNEALHDEKKSKTELEDAEMEALVGRGLFDLDQANDPEYLLRSWRLFQSSFDNRSRFNRTVERFVAARKKNANRG